MHSVELYVSLDGLSPGGLGVKYAFLVNAYFLLGCPTLLPPLPLFSLFGFPFCKYALFHLILAGRVSAFIPSLVSRLAVFFL